MKGLTVFLQRMQLSEVTPITARVPFGTLIGVFSLILTEVKCSESSVQTLDWVPLYPDVPNNLA